MSGIAGIYNLDGQPVDRRLLKRMTEFLAFRGPDAQDIWVDGQVGFGHTMLYTTSESYREHQPCSLDGQVWITADARIDGRAELIQKLQPKARAELKSATDVEIILHAYDVWGEACVEHLLGDFAFAIWDGRQQKLFCARDHFGVKPFYYAQTGASLVVSNTLNCVRLHPAVSDELNESAIADFLLFGYNQDSATTAFADIQRLPPAHYLTWSEGALRLNRYWTLPTDGQIRYKRVSDYVEHFRELLRVAVEDRLRADSIWAWMSGGLDSTSITAIAHERMSKQSKAFDLRAYTNVYDTLFPDNERHYAGLVAESLGIPIHYHALDGYAPFERWDQPELRRPEPCELSLVTMEIDASRHIAAQGRVSLCGYGGDPALIGEAIPHLLGRMPLYHLVADTVQLLLSHRRYPPFGLRPMLKRWLGRLRGNSEWPYPTWLNEAFESRLDLPARWKKSKIKPAIVHRLRPSAYNNLADPFWAYRFESHDPGVTRCPVEVRYPFFDRRLLDYLLAVPAIPWCIDKKLLREAMRDILPEPVRLRPKTVLAADPTQESLKKLGTQGIGQSPPSPKLAAYVNMIPQIVGEKDVLSLGLNIRVLCLNYWLQYLEPVNNQPLKEEHHELAL